jgi:hypothetical protein
MPPKVMVRHGVNQMRKGPKRICLIKYQDESVTFKS